MNVLWFVNIVMPEFSLALGQYQVQYGGWLSGLAGAIRAYAPEVRLTIAFLGKECRRVTVNRIAYYSLALNRKGSMEDSIKWLLSEVTPDVIHIHGTEAIAQMLPGWLFSKVPVVLSIQGIMEECSRHYLGGLRHEDLARHRSVCRCLFRRASPWKIAEEWERNRVPREREICKRVGYIIGRTDFDRLWTQSVNPSASYFHVEEIMRPEFYAPARDAKNIEPHTIYAGAAFSYCLKGGHWLVRAIHEVKKSYPDVLVRVAAGIGCKPYGILNRLRISEYHSYLRALMKEMGVADNFGLLPMLSAKEIWDILRRTEVFCLPSSMENSPNSLVEAQMAGVPSVVTSVGGVPSMVGSNEGVLAVPAEDPCALAKGLMMIFAERDDWQKKARMSAPQIAERHNACKVACVYRNIYGQMLRSAQ